MKGDKPVLKGEVQRDRQKIGNISLWRNSGRSGNQPHLKGVIETVDGKRRYQVSLWEQEKKGDVIEL